MGGGGRLRAYRVAAVVLVLAVVALAVRAILLLGEGDEVDTVETTEEAYSVADALAVVAGAEPVAVRGFVVDAGSFLGPELCQGLRDGDPPRCVGPSLQLGLLDPARLDLERAEAGERAVRWTDEPVTVLGTLAGTRFQVIEILN